MFDERPRRSRTFWSALPVLVLSLAVAGCGGSSSGSSGGATGAVKEIRVGLIFPTTGSMAALGDDQSRGAKLVLDWANQNGGIDGAKIRYFQADSQSDPGVAATVAQRLIDQDQVQILIGSYASGLAQAEVPVAARNKVLLWEVGAVSPTVNPAGNKYFIRTVGTSATYAGADVDFLENYLAAKLGRSAAQVRIGIAHEDGPFGTSVAAALVDLAKAKGLTIVANEAYPETSADLTPVVLRLKKARPDVVFIAPLVSSTMLFWQAAKTQNLTMAAIIGSAGFSSSSFLQKFGAKGVEGVYDVEPPAVENMSSANLAPDAKALLDQLKATFQSQTGHPCLVHCGDGSGGPHILVTGGLPAAVASGSVPGDSLRAAAAQTDMPDASTPQGFGAKFNAQGDNTLARSVIMQWQNGTLNVVYPPSVAAAPPIYPMPTWSQR